MNDDIPSFRDRPFLERVELRIAFHKVRDIFETCNKFTDADKAMLLEEISKRLLQSRSANIEPIIEPPAFVSSTPPATFADSCLDLAAAAPNDKIWSALLTIARICAAETDAAADQNFAPELLAAAGSW